MAAISIETLIKDLSEVNIAVGIHQGYALANNLIQDSEFMGSHFYGELYPYVRRATVEFAVDKFVQRQLPWVSSNFRFNKSKNYRHLELRYRNLILTLNAVSGINEFPRDAIYRTGLQISNQITLSELFLKQVMSLDQAIIRPVYMTVTYGRRESIATDQPDFIRLGLPHADRREYIDVINLPLENQPESIVFSEQLAILKDEFLREGKSIQDII